jgi:hypothetical protein
MKELLRRSAGKMIENIDPTLVMEIFINDGDLVTYDVVLMFLKFAVHFESRTIWSSPDAKNVSCSQ